MIFYSQRDNFLIILVFIFIGTKRLYSGNPSLSKWCLSIGSATYAYATLGKLLCFSDHHL